MSNSTLFEKILGALKECDRCTSYEALKRNVALHLSPILTSLLHLPLVKSLTPQRSPTECSPVVESCRQQLGSHDDVWHIVLGVVAGALRREGVGIKRRERSDSLPIEVLVNSFVLVREKGHCTVDRRGDEKKGVVGEKLHLRWSWLTQERDLFEQSDSYCLSNAVEKRNLRQKSVLSIFSETSRRAVFSSVWVSLLSSSNNVADLQLHVLHLLPDSLLPNLTNPLQLADFVVSCFRGGGLLSVLSLRGIFLLMLDHGLEYPEFYNQLYQLITPHSFASRYRAEVFRLLDLCMKSSLIPEYVVAAIIKKTMRVALLSPSPTLYFLIPFVRQLLQRHPNCLSLIHRPALSQPSEDEDGTEKKKVGVEDEKVRQLFAGKDPFDASSRTPDGSFAVSSTLWELAVLEHHFLPIVPLLVQSFHSPAEDRTPIMPDKTYSRLLSAELTRHSASKVPSVSAVKVSLTSMLRY